MDIKRFQTHHCWYFLLAILVLSGAIVTLVGSLNYQTFQKVCSIILIAFGVILMVVPFSILLTKVILSMRRTSTFELPSSPVSWNLQQDDQRQLTNAIVIPKELEAEDLRIPRGIIALLDEN